MPSNYLSISKIQTRILDAIDRRDYQGLVENLNLLTNRRNSINEPVKIARDFETTLLHYAVYHGWFEGMRKLYKKGANLDAIDTNCKTPLHLAIKHKYSNIASYLVKKGANPNAKNRKGRTALEEAESKGQRDIVMLIIEEISLAHAYQVLNKTPREGNSTNSTNAMQPESSLANRSVECSCCCVVVPCEEVVRCKIEDSHCLCFECTKKLAQVAIGKSEGFILCVSTAGCEGFISPKGLVQAIGEDMMDHLIRLQSKHEALKAGISLKKCPFCNCDAEYDSNRVYEVFECPNRACKVVSCFSCHSKAHPGKTCEEAKKATMSIEEEILEAMNKAAITQSCPNCQEGIIKLSEPNGLENCNELTCRCGCKVCNECGENITEAKYDHFFKKNARCNLFEDLDSSAVYARKEIMQQRVWGAKMRVIHEKKAQGFLDRDEEARLMQIGEEVSGLDRTYNPSPSSYGPSFRR